jgi:hypothetical protein
MNSKRAAARDCDSPRQFKALGFCSEIPIEIQKLADENFELLKGSSRYHLAKGIEGINTKKARTLRSRAFLKLSNTSFA